jgi:type II restriction enzyme
VPSALRPNPVSQASAMLETLYEIVTYEELLNCFERVGIELRPEIDEYFSKFK